MRIRLTLFRQNVTELLRLKMYSFLAAEISGLQVQITGANPISRENCFVYNLDAAQKICQTDDMFGQITANIVNNL